MSTHPLTSAEVLKLKNDFPILGRSVNGKPLNYLDSAATSQKPLSVIDAETEFYQQRNAAVHRGAHTLAAEATELFEEARERLACFAGAGVHEIVWTSNATEGINLIAYGFAHATAGRGGKAAERFRLVPGDRIVITEAEHHANLIPWQELVATTGAVLDVIPVLENGELDLETAASLIGPRTKILAFSHLSNVLGLVNPVAELVKLAREVGAYTVLDACQSAPHLPLNLRELGVDFAVFSGHKMLGPTGIGVLYGRQELLDALPPFLTGGSMITTVTLERAEYLPSPQRFEAGTQRVSQAIALARAVDYLELVGLPRVAEWEAKLGEQLVTGLMQLEGIRVLGAEGRGRAGLASFDVEGVHAHDVGQFLDNSGIAVRVGHHCAQPLHRRFGLTATARASAYLYTTEDEVAQFLEAVSGVRKFFGVA